MSPPMASPLVSPGAGDAIEGFRRRPSAASLILPIYSDLSNTTSVELEDEPHYDEEKKNGDYSAVQMEPGVPPHGGWRVGPAPKGGRRPLGRMAWTGTLIVVATMGGWVVGRAKGFELATSASTGVGLGGAYGASTSRLFGAPPTPERCNPYVSSFFYPNGLPSTDSLVIFVSRRTNMASCACSFLYPVGLLPLTSLFFFIFREGLWTWRSPRGTSGSPCPPRRDASPSTTRRKCTCPREAISRKRSSRSGIGPLSSMETA